MPNPKIDYGESHWVRTNPDALSREPFVAVPDPIRPRPPGPPASSPEVRINDEVLRQAMATYAETKATAEIEIRNLEKQIQGWRERVQIARNRLSSIQGV